MLTMAQVDLMAHSLGGNKPTKWYRNHFVAGVDHSDYEDLVILEENGYMKRMTSPSFMPDDSITFIVTEKGKQHFR